MRGVETTKKVTKDAHLLCLWQRTTCLMCLFYVCVCECLGHVWNSLHWNWSEPGHSRPVCVCVLTETDLISISKYVELMNTRTERKRKYLPFEFSWAYTDRSSEFYRNIYSVDLGLSNTHSGYHWLLGMKCKIEWHKSSDFIGTKMKLFNFWVLPLPINFVANW